MRTFRSSSAGNVLALLMCGLGVGWLLGLATTPVLNIVLTSVIAALGAVTVVLMRMPKDANSEERSAASFRRGAPFSTTAAPLAVVIFGLSVGAPAGLAAREYRWFTPAPAEPADLRSDGMSGNVGKGESRAAAHVPGLFDAPLTRSECAELLDRIEDPDQLSQVMRQGHPAMRAAATRAESHAARVFVVNILCDPTLWATGTRQ